MHPSVTALQLFCSLAWSQKGSLETPGSRGSRDPILASRLELPKTPAEGQRWSAMHTSRFSRCEWDLARGGRRTQRDSLRRKWKSMRCPIANLQFVPAVAATLSSGYRGADSGLPGNPRGWNLAVPALAVRGLVHSGGSLYCFGRTTKQCCPGSLPGPILPSCAVLSVSLGWTLCELRQPQPLQLSLYHRH